MPGGLTSVIRVSAPSCLLGNFYQSTLNCSTEIIIDDTAVVLFSCIPFCLHIVFWRKRQSELISHVVSDWNLFFEFVGIFSIRKIYEHRRVREQGSSCSYRVVVSRGDCHVVYDENWVQETWWKRDGWWTLWKRERSRTENTATAFVCTSLWRCRCGTSVTLVHRQTSMNIY